MANGNHYVQTEVIKIKQGDSTVTQTILIKKSDFGFLIEEKDGKALALRLSGFDRPFFMQQFVEMAKSKNLKDFESAMGNAPITSAKCDLC